MQTMDIVSRRGYLEFFAMNTTGARIIEPFLGDTEITEALAVRRGRSFSLVRTMLAPREENVVTGIVDRLWVHTRGRRMDVKSETGGQTGGAPPIWRSGKNDNRVGFGF